MLKLLCINSKPVRHDNGKSSEGTGLTEGEIYTAGETLYIHPNNRKPCYLIRELADLKLAGRFLPLSDIDETERPIREEIAEVLTERD